MKFAEAGFAWLQLWGGSGGMRERSYSCSPSPPRGGYGRRGRSPSPRGRYSGRGRDASTSLLVRNLRHDCRAEDLRRPFSHFGLVKDIYLPRDYYTRKPRGFGFVQFVNPTDAADAKYHMDGQILFGRELTVVFAEENRKRPSEMRAREHVRDRHHESRRSSRYSRSPRHSRSPPPCHSRSTRSPPPCYSRSPRPHYSRSPPPRSRYQSRSRSHASLSPCPKDQSRSVSPADHNLRQKSQSLVYSGSRSRSHSPQANYSRQAERENSMSKEQ